MPATNCCCTGCCGHCCMGCWLKGCCWWCCCCCACTCCGCRMLVGITPAAAGGAMLPAAPAAAGSTAVAAASRQQLRRSSSVRPSSVATSAAADASMLASRATVSAASPASAPAALPCTPRCEGHMGRNRIRVVGGEQHDSLAPGGTATISGACWQAGRPAMAGIRRRLTSKYCMLLATSAALHASSASSGAACPSPSHASTGGGMYGAAAAPLVCPLDGSQEPWFSSSRWKWRLYADCWRRVERAPAGVVPGGRRSRGACSGARVRGV